MKKCFYDEKIKKKMLKKKSCRFSYSIFLCWKAFLFLFIEPFGYPASYKCKGVNLISETFYDGSDCTADVLTTIDVENGKCSSIELDGTTLFYTASWSNTFCLDETGKILNFKKF